ncbi:CoA transferase [Acinetobacter baumannii]
MTRESGYFQCTNRNKYSVAVDITTPEGQALIYEIAKTADVVIENYKTGSLAKYGLDYASLSELNPNIVYCSITGFGQDGPRAEEPGYDFIIQGMSGLMSITGEPDDVNRWWCTKSWSGCGRYSNWFIFNHCHSSCLDCTFTHRAWSVY